MTEKVQFPYESRLSSETTYDSLLVEWSVQGALLIKKSALKQSCLFHHGCKKKEKEKVKKKVIHQQLGFTTHLRGDLNSYGKVCLLKENVWIWEQNVCHMSRQLYLLNCGHSATTKAVQTWRLLNVPLPKCYSSALTWNWQINGPRIQSNIIRKKNQIGGQHYFILLYAQPASALDHVPSLTTPLRLKSNCLH